MGEHSDINKDKMADNVSCESVKTHEESNTNEKDDTNNDPSPVCENNTVKEDSFKIPEGICKLKTTDKPNTEPGDSQNNSAQTTDSDTVASDKLKSDGDRVTKQRLPHVKPAELSPDEILKQAQIAFPYKEPTWSGIPEEQYNFEVLKNGAIIDTINLTGTKPFYVFGRLPSCDFTLEHPSLSRYHAVLQYCQDHTDEHNKGWYLYDLDSTHGTWVNKIKVKPKVYHRVRVGHVVKFGGSTRLHVLQGPEDDQEEESSLSVTELKEQREHHKREAEVLRQADMQEEQLRVDLEQQRHDSEGCSWGIGEDAEEPEEGNPLVSLVPKDEHLYVDDPKKALKGYFEREGYDLPDYQFVEAATGKHKCTVELPVDSPTGEPIVAEAVVSGKRKDAVVVCALEACRILDKLGVLRASKHASRQRKGKNWEDDDFYDSDEDTFLDRTGTIEKKRILRMKKLGKSQHDKAETFASLSEKHKDISNQIEEIERKLAQAKADAAVFEDEEEDALDAYMSAIKCGVMDTKTRMSLKRQLIELKKEEIRLRRLVNIAKPATLPEIIRPVLQNKPLVKPNLALVGRMKMHKTNVKKPVAQPEKFTPDEHGSGEEEDEDDEDSEKKSFKDISDDKTDSETETMRSKRLADEESPKSGSDDTQTDLTVQKKSSKRSSSELIKNSEKKSKKTGTLKDDYDVSDPDYAVWMPPKGQCGDGRTHLNDKFGY
ncbi:kanadaptin-like isoform X2 [Gigantopelta aegis]|uniref:kanadaptin-like isoform X2 n=1 Tax=Gigantopelta aegis TaxID=1735272 RepID=UPI001B88A211|nr:kanadaptin-like isoform X2 [Gigantopelta aegis]